MNAIKALLASNVVIAVFFATLGVVNALRPAWGQSAICLAISLFMVVCGVANYRNLKKLKWWSAQRYAKPQPR